MVKGASSLMDGCPARARTSGGRCAGSNADQASSTTGPHRLKTPSGGRSPTASGSLLAHFLRAKPPVRITSITLWTSCQASSTPSRISTDGISQSIVTGGFFESLHRWIVRSVVNGQKYLQRLYLPESSQQRVDFFRRLRRSVLHPPKDSGPLVSVAMGSSSPATLSPLPRIRQYMSNHMSNSINMWIGVWLGRVARAAAWVDRFRGARASRCHEIIANAWNEEGSQFESSVTVSHSVCP
ncbi:hypothetical protein T10_6023 [Trichinella papuae]|uniref:Uncharacterized protein n=1 Tax=Trichinella papuae TaxID=268474 RepID=A0A0V1MG84_9BILA|nr:hypothetical protein T10_6023 [Trichinella papuae]